MMEEQPFGPLQNFPNIGYEAIFNSLSIEDLLNCRLVCSEWYRNIAKIFKHPNCFSIGESKAKNDWGLTSNKCTKLENYLSLKYFEDPMSPIEVLNIQSLNLMKWRNCLQKSNEFQRTTKNITELTLKNVHFQSRKIMVEFLNSFVKLNRLVIHDCRFDTLQKFKCVKIACKFITQSVTNEPFILLAKPKILDIEMKQNSLSMLLAIDVLCCKLKEQNLQDLKFTLQSYNEKKVLIKYKHINKNHIVAHTISELLSHLIKKHEKTLKCLNVNWSTENRDWVVCAKNEFIKKLAKTANFSDLTLNHLEMDFGTIYPFPSPNRAIIPDLVEFLIYEIQKGLRKINLGLLPSIVDNPISISVIMDSLVTKLDALPKRPMDLRIEYDHLLLVDGTRDDLNKFNLVFNYNFNLYRTSMKKNEIRIINQEVPSNVSIVENFKEYLWDYNWNIISYCKLHIKRYDFIDLTELFINCQIKGLKSYSISTICFLCPNLIKLKILDGPEFKYHSKKSDVKRQYEGMSQAVINDYDIKFILCSLTHLKELVIWANMSAVTDRAFILYHSQENAETDRYSFADHESYIEFAYLANLFYTFSETVQRYPLSIDEIILLESEISKNKKEELEFACIANLKALTHLSLRGVGEKISDEIMCNKSGLSSVHKLKCLEILGDHKISEQGKQLVQHLKEVRFK